MIPEADILDGQIVPPEVLSGQVLLGRELRLVDPVKPVGLASEGDVVGDVGTLGHDLVGGDTESLDEARIKAEADNARADQQAEAPQDQSPAALGDLREAEEGGKDGRSEERRVGKECRL